MDYKPGTDGRAKRGELRGFVNGVRTELETIRCEACGKVLLKQSAVNFAGRCVHCGDRVL